MISSRRTLGAVFACLALSVLAVFAPAPVGASAAAPEASGHKVQFVQVNSTDPSKVDVVFRYDGNASDVAGMKLQENGKDVKAAAAQTLTQAQRQQGIVFVVDTSQSTDANNALVESKNAIKALVEKTVSIGCTGRRLCGGRRRDLRDG